MKVFSMIAAALLSIVSGAGGQASPDAGSGKSDKEADDVSARLKGEWLNTVKYENSPRSVLRFEGNKVNFELFGRTGSAEYKVTEKKSADSFTIKFEYSYKEKRGNGRIVEYTDRPELMFHVENGRPVLSETMFECDGRGLIIMGESLRKENFVDGFQSELRHRLNDQTPIPTMQEVPEEDVPPKVE